MHRLLAVIITAFSFAFPALSYSQTTPVWFTLNAQEGQTVTATGSITLRFGQVARFAENLTIQKHERISSHHEHVRMFLGHCACLEMRIELAKLQRRQIFVIDLLRITRDHLKFQLELPEQFRAARRG